MSLSDNLLSFLKKKKSKELEETPNGFCPGCWGRQEYGGKFYDAVYNHNKLNKSDSPQKGWIQDYADKNLYGIQLNYENDLYECPSCKLTYRPS